MRYEHYLSGMLCKEGLNQEGLSDFGWLEIVRYSLYTVQA